MQTSMFLKLLKMIFVILGQKKGLITGLFYLYEQLNYFTATNSVSKIKVAFGGITPPAPLFP